MLIPPLFHPILPAAQASGPDRPPRTRSRATGQPAVVRLSILWAGLVAVCAGLAGPPAARAGQSINILPLREIESADAAMPAREKIKRLQEGMQAQKIRIHGSRQKENLLLAELEEIDRRLERQQEKIARLQEQIVNQQRLIEVARENLDPLVAEKEAFKTHVTKRLVAYYQTGSITILDELFAARSLPDLLNFEEYYRVMLKYDREVITAYQSKIDTLRRAEETLRQEKNHWAALVEQVSGEEEVLTATRREKLALLARVSTENKLYRQALAEMQAATSGLAATLGRLGNAMDRESDLTAESPAPDRRPFSGRDFAAQKGRLSPPAPGVVAKRGRQQPGLAGIDIRTAPGAPVRAVYDGQIVHADYLRGYGNLLIIDHGRHYFSVIARLAKLLKKENSLVTSGEVIGIMGENEMLFGEGLYFEIRQGAKAENPLLWLDPAQIEVEP